MGTNINRIVMRTIKFRGKDISTGEWRYGDLVQFEEDGVKRTTIFTGGLKGLTYSVKPNTIGQFTGLYDSIGRGIYEEDIIRSFDSKGEPIIHVIVYDNNDAKFIAVLAGYTKYDFGCGGITQKWINEFEKEVIGNIHDNPELLKPNKYETTTM